MCAALGDYMGVKIHRCMGGKSIKDSIKALKSGSLLAKEKQHLQAQFRAVPGTVSRSGKKAPLPQPRGSHHLWNSRTRALAQ